MRMPKRRWRVELAVPNPDGTVYRRTIHGEYWFHRNAIKMMWHLHERLNLNYPPSNAINMVRRTH